ncbi:GspH/FimT family pseudopilin [Caldimonas tepidiphila]|uniref:GspH/FimT family pseudopilin n=1 Tax=Caldimonas tepidiphila TaxID=2315841 RepID=UPI000E5C50AE|nr:GspH/FimT family pseudopilin [Caldimonas tepidiphila]
MRRPVRSPRGLTLIESMVVLAVMAILATQAAPAFNSFLAASRLRGAASQLTTDLRNARSEAVTRNTEVTVTFSATGYSLDSGGTTLRSVVLAGGTTISSGNGTTVTFTRRGILDPVSSAAVTLANSSHSLQVTLHPLGRVQCEVLSGNASC